MRYGVPYKGSKNRIAAEIVKRLPAAENFYDLFAGGCAVAHAALLSKKYKNVIVNDINDDGITLFCNAVNGKYKDETRWISREDFNRLKDTDPYVKLCWSYGNNGMNYLYSKEVEPWKKALHYARVYGDNSLFRNFGIDTDGNREDIIAREKEYKTKYITWFKRNMLNQESEDIADLEKMVKNEKEKLRAYLTGALKASGLTIAEVKRYLFCICMAKGGSETIKLIQ